MPLKVFKTILTAKPEQRAMFGSVCQDFLAQMEIPHAPFGGGGEGGGNTGRALSHKELVYTSPADFPFLVERLRRLLNRLKVRPSRRLEHTHRSRLIDVKRSIRRSFRFGGAMFALDFRRPRLRRPRIVILCDVSASMIQHIPFTLPLLFGLSQTTNASRAFVCAGGMEEVTDFFRQNNDFQQVRDWLLQRTTQVGRGTNLGQAFHDLRVGYPGVLSPSTCLFVVSDAETVDPDFAIRELGHIAEKVKKLIW